MSKTELIVALDFSEEATAKKWVDTFSGQPIIYKIGLELFLTVGPKWVSQRIHEGNRIFLDLKLHDIPNTVAQAVGVACDLGVEFLTIHLSGGEMMLIKSVEKVREKKSSLKLLGVSVLTSFSEEGWNEVTETLGAGKISIGKSIHHLSLAAKKANVPGLVCSGLDLAVVKKNVPSLFCVTPGIRLETSRNQDQNRVVSPRQARELGANAIVMGRPIFQSENPGKTLEIILKELQ